jgi:hypothetical protein
MDLGHDSDPDPSIFIIDFQDANKKTNLEKSFSTNYILQVLFHHFSTIKSEKKSQISRNNVFLIIFDRRIQISIQEAQKHVYPVGPDPQP